ncbi:MAG: DUF1800 domain-containing protein [Verrucomicrobiota bacterium]
MNQFRLLFAKTLLLACAIFLHGSPVEAQVAGAVAVYPQNSSLESASSQFSAYVPISPATIEWMVDGVVGGNATVGTISATGLYKRPAAIPTPNVVTIAARSTAYPASIGKASLTLTRAVPHLWSVSPSTLQAGNYQVRFNGSNFAPDSIATANGIDVATTYLSPTSLQVKGFASAGTILFQVRQPGPGAVTGEKINVPVAVSTVTVAVTPASASIALGGSRAFSVTVTGNSNTAVTWSVHGIGTIGSITSAGVYTAPAIMPASPTVTLRATSVANPASFAQALVTLTVPPPLAVTVTVTPATPGMPLGTTRVFSAAVANAVNPAVIWSVNGIEGGSPALGMITPAGAYTAPAAAPSSGVSIRATSVAAPSAFAQVTLTFTSPPPAQSWLPGARFLEQSSFGPTPATLAQVKQMGIEAYLQQQFSLPETPIPLPASNSMHELQQWVLYNYSTAPDQLRQRVAYALSQIVVTSANKLVYANEIVPWMRLLSKNAFGNYRTLLRELSVSPSMGKYLDLANSKRPGLSGGANENYARELLQLFTIGIWELNQDGSLQIDPATAEPIPTYNQQTVAQIALALTGWTFPTPAGSTPNPAGNWESFNGPMETRPASHDPSAKRFLGTTLPAGQSVEADLDGVIDRLFEHPNLAPFIATRLIRSLVMSNPSPGYITRVADVFDNNGAGVRGDLKAVIAAILTDAEARQDVPGVNGGRLKEPILQTVGLLRALGGAYLTTEQVTYMYEYMAQRPLSPPSVFSWFSPLYRIPKSPLAGPEFQIYTPSEAMLRGNFLYWLLTTPAGSATLDLTPFQAYGNDMPGLVEAVNQALLHGRMEPAMKQILINAATPGYDAATRIATVLYLTALSGQYAVQY